MNAEQIKEEIRKLSRIGKREIARWLDREAAADLLIRIGVTETGQKPNACNQYRVMVRGVGMVYDGDSALEANRRFRIFVLRSRAEYSTSANETVTLFKNYDIIRQYHPPEF